MKLQPALCIIFFLFIIVFASAPSAYALTATPSGSKAIERAEQRQKDIESRRSEVQTQREAMLENRCAMITKRIQTRTEHYNKVKDARLAQYQHAKDVIKAIEQRLKNQGCQTTEIEADLKSLDTFIKEFDDTYKQFIQSLSVTENQVCAENKSSSYAATAQKAQDQLALVKEKGIAIRNLYLRSIRNDVQDARLQCIDQQRPKSASVSANKPIKIRQEAK